MMLMDVEDEYRRHAPALIHYATILVGPNDASDVVNEAVTATLARGSLDGVSNVRAYWFRAVTNTAAGLHRSRLRRQRRESLTAARVAVASGDLEEPTDARRVLGVLSLQQRSVVYLTYWHDWDPARIADVLGVSEGTVRKQLARGRQQLREVLDNEQSR